MRLWIVVAAACLLATSAAAQVESDQRDVVVTTRGTAIRGRVVQRFDPDNIMLLQRGKRVRVARKRVKSITTINDQLRQFFAFRKDARNSPGREWLLVEWAAAHGLDRMAALQAMHVVLEQDQHKLAHEFLGHRRFRDHWLWRRGSQWMTFEKYQRETSHWGHPKIIESEHYKLRSSAGLRDAIDTLFDLERFYLYWFDEFGQQLRPREAFVPMNVFVYRDRDSFPGWTSNRTPYYWPQPNGDISYTYVPDGGGRPELLFDLATSQLLYNTMADGIHVGRYSRKDRYAAWIEIGLGQWMQSAMHGPAGYAQPGRAKLPTKYASAILDEQPYSLPNLIGVRYSRFHDVTSQTRLHWAFAASFVSFLMDDEKPLATRDKMLTLIDQTYNHGVGASSSLFDRVFQTKIEKLQRPLDEWLSKQAVASAPARSGH